MGGTVLLAGSLLLASFSPAAGVPRQGDADAQLVYATRAKRSLRGTRGERRDQARTMVVEAYRAVRVYFPEARSTGAEAAFRAAELLRSGRLIGASREAFEQAWLLGRGVRIGARAGLELGHLERRRLRLNDALGWYEDVESLGPEFAEERDLAAYWAGRVHGRMGRAEDALRCYERAARKGVEPLQRVRAYEAWIDGLLDQDRLEAAAGVWSLCQGSLRQAAEERSTLGMRVRAALEGMRSPGRLARAVEERRRSGRVPWRGLQASSRWRSR